MDYFPKLRQLPHYAKLARLGGRSFKPVGYLNKYHRRILRALLTGGPDYFVKIIMRANRLRNVERGTKHWHRTERALEELWNANLIDERDSKLKLTMEGWVKSMELESKCSHS